MPVFYPFKGRLFFVFHFFELSVNNIVVLRVALGSVSAASLLLSVLLLRDFHQLLRSLSQRLHFRFNISFIFTFQRSFQRGQRRLDSGFIVSRQLVACFLNLLTRAVQQVVTLVAGLYQLDRKSVV